MYIYIYIYVCIFDIYIYTRALTFENLRQVICGAYGRRRSTQIAIAAWATPLLRLDGFRRRWKLTRRLFKSTPRLSLVH